MIDVRLWMRGWTDSKSARRRLGPSRRRSDGLERAAWRPPRPVAQCRQFQEGAKDASVSECTWTLSALEALHNALYKFKTYLLTYLQRTKYRRRCGVRRGKEWRGHSFLAHSWVWRAYTSNCIKKTVPVDWVHETGPATGPIRPLQLLWSCTNCWIRLHWHCRCLKVRIIKIITRMYAYNSWYAKSAPTL